MRLPGQLPLAQAQAQVVAQAQVAELARLRVLVQMQAQRLVSEPELELALGLQLERELPLVWVLEPPLVRVPELELVQMQGREPAQQPELAAVLEQARKLRVSRQLVQQQHRLPTAAQERPPYLPALPMKAPCWGVPAW